MQHNHNNVLLIDDLPTLGVYPQCLRRCPESIWSQISVRANPNQRSLKKKEPIMKMNIARMDIEIPAEVRRQIERKLARLGRLTKDIKEIRLELVEEKTKSRQDRFLSRLSVDISNTLLYGEERGENVLTAFDRAVAKVERQLEYHKGKLRDRVKSSLPGTEPVPSQLSAATPRKVAKTKKFTMKPMTLTEAADQMELLGHSFFLFYNFDSDKLNLIYRRKDGNYGLIEPEKS
jgi:putative sigma-54 modulation protein